MDDDEPIYRNYFKMINDNIVYPIKQPLITHPILHEKYIDKNETFLIESIYLDRRMHISAPGKTTQFKIDEYYDNQIENNFKTNNGISDEKYNSILAQKESYKIISKICNKSLTGEILLFLTGENEIKNAIKYLNNNLPSENIVLPFYANIANEYRDIITNINLKISKIRNKRENIISEWGSKYIKVSDVPEGTYKRAIIVATNVAEASITISSLKYVVDTGYSKVPKYDSKIDKIDISIEKISESSRIQRKGRVGRRSNGTVYYMYSMGSRENIKPKYSINQDNISTSFLKLSQKYKENNKNLFLIHLASPYLLSTFKNFHMNNFMMGKVDKNRNVKVKDLYKIVDNQYVIENDIYLDENFFLSPYFNFYHTSKRLPSQLILYEDGYSHDQLIDSKGELYIIHPFESTIKRNINNDIIKNINNQKINKINKNLFNYYFQNMEYKMYYLNIGNQYITNYVKTDFYLKIVEANNLIGTLYNNSETTLLLLGIGYGIKLEICEILSMLKVINYDITSLCLSDNKKDFENLFNKFNSNSDILSIFKICKFIRDSFSDLEIYKIFNKTTSIKKYKIQYNTLLELYYNKEFTINPPEKLRKYWNTFNRLKAIGMLNNERGFLYFIQESNFFIDTINDNLEKNYPEIQIFCEKNFIKFDIIKLYFNTLLQLFKNLNFSSKELDNRYNELSPFDWILKIKNNLLKSLIYPNLENKILYCFYITYPMNVAVRLDNNNKDFILIKSGAEANLLLFKNKIKTLCTSVSNYVFYLDLKKVENKNSIMFYSNINPKDLAYTFPIHYNKKKIKNLYSFKNIDNNNKSIKKYFGINWDFFINEIVNYSSLNYFPLNNSKELIVINKYLKKN